MKFVILCIFQFVLLSSACGQSLYSEVVKVDSTIKKATLFSNSLAWFAYQFKSSNDVIQMKDFESGKIIGKGIFENYYFGEKLTPRNIVITLTIKDGKYKYDIDLDEKYFQFPIDLKSGCFNCGRTTAMVVYSNKTVKIVNISTANGYYQYDNVNVSALDKATYNKWRAKVDAELPSLTTKINNDVKTLQQQDTNNEQNSMNVFIEALKKQMAKTDFDF